MTLPTDLYDLPTMAQALALAEATPEESYACPSCPRQVPAEGMVDTAGLPGDLPDYVCHTCASGPHRIALANQASRPTPSWAATCEIGNTARAERQRRLQACDWTQTLDAPLTSEAVVAWAAYRQALRDITEAFTSPDLIEWPAPPALGPF